MAEGGKLAPIGSTGSCEQESSDRGTLCRSRADLLNSESVSFATLVYYLVVVLFSTTC